MGRLHLFMERHNGLTTLSLSGLNWSTISIIPRQTLLIVDQLTCCDIDGTEEFISRFLASARFPNLTDLLITMYADVGSEFENLEYPNFPKLRKLLLRICR